MAGFANIPVCKSDGRETMDTAAVGDSSEFAFYEPMIALPGTITLKECYLSMSDSPRGYVSSISSLEVTKQIQPLSEYK